MKRPAAVQDEIEKRSRSLFPLRTAFLFICQGLEQLSMSTSLGTQSSNGFGRTPLR
nr:hypothetical protein Q903MT_gene5040 [Picea sitchensis]